MSGKKQKVLTGWFDCSKCGRKISRQLMTKHAGDEESVCKPVYPYLRKSELFCLLLNVTTATKKIGDLPFIKDKRIASSTVFLSEELIKECGFTSFSWVTVNPISAQCSKQGDVFNHDTQSGCLEMEETSISPYAFRVWPIPESIGSNQCTLQVVLSMEGFSTNRLVPFNLKTDFNGDAPIGLSSIQKLSSSVNTSQNIFQNATEIVLVLTNSNEIDQGSFEVDRFVKSFQRLFQGRPVAVNNRFKIRFYSQFVYFYVKSISSDYHENKEALGLDRLSINESNPRFYVIGQNTNVQIANTESLEEMKPEDLSRKVFFEDMGGLANVISEVKSTVNFILNTELDVPKGLLLYGNTGVGKTMMVDAVVNEFSIFKISYEEFPKPNSISSGDHANNKSLEKIFKDAVSRSPSVVVVEALDVIAPRKKSDSGAAPLTPFAAQFLRLASSPQVQKAKVLIICTTTDLERIDPNMRSPKLFAKEIEIPIPAAPEREGILRKVLRNIRHRLTDEEIKFISDNTHGFVAADLRSLCNQALLDVVTKATATTGSGVGVTMGNIEECLKLVKPSAIKSILIDVPNVKWSDIGGQDDLKFKLKQAIEWPLKHPESFKRLGITSPKGILMYGPPGCSKTMIAKAIATESRLNFISVKGSELFSKWVGESEKAVQAIFRKARQVAPCVIFFDEIDSLGGERGTSSGSSNVHERVLAQILVEMDGIEALRDVTIVAATNRPDRIDQALLRPGRLDRIIYVPLPDDRTRREILKIRFKKMPVSPDINIDELVKLTNNYSGAELTAVCHEAALKALEEDITCDIIKQHHFDAALLSVHPRITKEQIDFYQNYSKTRKQH